MKLWNDGRSGDAGCLAGNLVLARIRDGKGEVFRERKGTTFRGRASIWVGRICSTDSYLNARDRHWANLSIDQHREIMSEAGLEGSTVKYLFITALMNQPLIHYWVIPGDVIDRVAFAKHQNESEFVYSLHIRENNGRFELEEEDVSSFHQVLQLQPADATKLNQQFMAAKQLQAKRAARRAAVTDDGTTAMSTRIGAGMTENEFRIPLRGGRSAVLSVPIPTAEVDLQRIKGWIDLMSDVLTEDPGVGTSPKLRRAEAGRAVTHLQEHSVKTGNTELSDEQIESEIRTVRRERKG
jgi:hypothetical protein